MPGCCCFFFCWGRGGGVLPPFPFAFRMHCSRVLRLLVRLSDTRSNLRKTVLTLTKKTHVYTRGGTPPLEEKANEAAARTQQEKRAGKENKTSPVGLRFSTPTKAPIPSQRARNRGRGGGSGKRTEQWERTEKKNKKTGDKFHRKHNRKQKGRTRESWKSENE